MLKLIKCVIRFVRVKRSEAEADKIKMVGEADASSTLAIGSAEAEMMRLKADAYKQYGEAAKMSLVLECLPKIAAEVRRAQIDWHNILIYLFFLKQQPIKSESLPGICMVKKLKR